MRLGRDRADDSPDSPAADQKPGSAAGSRFAAKSLVTWHGDALAWVDRLGWLRTVSDQVAAVLVPFRAAPGQSGP